MSYFILRSTEDGTTISKPLEHAEVMKRITPNKDGETHYGQGITFLQRVPESDKGCWYAPDNAVLIIKGEIIVPKAIETVTAYEL